MRKKTPKALALEQNKATEKYRQYVKGLLREQKRRTEQFKKQTGSMRTHDEPLAKEISNTVTDTAKKVLHEVYKGIIAHILITFTKQQSSMKWWQYIGVRKITYKTLPYWMEFHFALKGTATLIISMFHKRDLYKPWILIQVLSKSAEKWGSYGCSKNSIWLTFGRHLEYLISFQIFFNC